LHLITTGGLRSSCNLRKSQLSKMLKRGYEKTNLVTTVARARLQLGALAPRESLGAIMPLFINMVEGKLTGLEAGAVEKDLLWILETQNPVDVIGGVRVSVLVVVGSNDQMTTQR
jgi:hypothetical protein